MTFESAVGQIHEGAFLREFTYSTSTFVPSGGTEIELADGLIAIGEEMAIVQIKERSPPPLTTPEMEKKWFQKKVLGDATRQMRATVAHMRGQGTISLINRHGQAVDLRLSSKSRVHQIVLYRGTSLLPPECQAVTHHISRTSGLIHIFNSTDYLGLVSTLLIPREYFDYLAFREELFKSYANVPGLPERALLGQYLSGQLTSQPDIRYTGFLHALADQREKWDVSDILQKFGDRITSTAGEKDYYLILQELAELTRAELQPFKERFTAIVENASVRKVVMPYRMAIPRRNCGFAFVAFTQAQVRFAQDALLKLTLAHKHDQKLQRCVGIAVWREGNEYPILWTYVDSPWKPDPEMDRFITESHVLSQVRAAEVPRYEFGNPN